MFNVIFLLPVYNESRSIYDLCLEISRLIKNKKIYCQVIIVNDASKDDSLTWIKKAQKEVKNYKITLFNHKENKGLKGALNTGLNALRKILKEDDIVVMMDGDNTHNPYLVENMIQKHREGADLVIASRYCEQSRIKGVSLWRIFLSWGAKWLYRIFWRIKGVKDYTCLFRSHRAAIIKQLLDDFSGEDILQQDSFACTTELLNKLSKSGKLEWIITEVPMLLDYTKKVGTSNVNILSTIITSLKIMIKKV